MKELLKNIYMYMYIPHVFIPTYITCTYMCQSHRKRSIWSILIFEIFTIL